MRVLRSSSNGVSFTLSRLMQEFNTEDAARCLEQAQQDEHATTGDAGQLELFGNGQRFKRLYFDDTMKLDSFAPEVSLQQDWGWEVMPFISDLMTKLTTNLCGRSECHEELSIFIDHDWFVFTTLMRDLVNNIAEDAKDTALTFEIASNVQDLCDAIFSTKAGVDRLLDEMKITMHVLARLCAEAEKNVSKNFGCIVIEKFVGTLVFQRNAMWIALWMVCMVESDNMNDILNSVRRRAVAQVIREHSTMM